MIDKVVAGPEAVKAAEEAAPATSKNAKKGTPVEFFKRYVLVGEPKLLAKAVVLRKPVGTGHTTYWPIVLPKIELVPW